MNRSGSAKNSIKRGLIRLVALLFVVYALADVTVLQAYCGNEAVGIPPANYISKSTASDANRYLANYVQSRDGSDEKRQNGDEPAQNCNDDACFCCCSHIIAGHFLFPSKPLTSAFVGLRHYVYAGRHANYELTNFFRPPRTA